MGTAEPETGSAFGMKWLRSIGCLALLVASCTDLPYDPNGTLDRVRSQGGFRVGIVTNGGDRATADRVRALLEQVGATTGAAPRVARGDAEPMLDQLKNGELDLVIGWFEKKSPWSTLVTIGPALRTQKRGKVEFRLAPAMQNGENAWIALIEREVRSLAPESQ